MFESVVCAVGAVLAVTGLVCIVYWLMLRLIRPKKNEEYFEVLVFDGKEENASLRVSFLLTRLLSTGGIRHCRILAVDNGMKPWRSDALRETFGREPRVTVCTPEEANEILFEKKD